MMPEPVIEIPKTVMEIKFRVRWWLVTCGMMACYWLAPFVKHEKLVSGLSRFVKRYAIKMEVSG